MALQPNPSNMNNESYRQFHIRDISTACGQVVSQGSQCSNNEMMTEQHDENCRFHWRHQRDSTMSDQPKNKLRLDDEGNRFAATKFLESRFCCSKMQACNII
jgi:hypothetical protein